jgi:stage II sporulation protein R
MKRIFIVITLAVLIASLGGEGEVARIHILANSDLEKDREIKMKVVEEVGEIFSEREFDSLEEGLSSIAEEVEKTANEVLLREGAGYLAKAQVVYRHFESRALSNALFPEGEYLTLTVVLGKGEGKNFWSVMFPRITLGASFANGEEGRGKTALIGGEAVVKMRCLLLEIFNVDKRIKKE